MTHDWWAEVRAHLQHLAALGEFMWVLPLNRCTRCHGELRRAQTWVIAARGYRHDTCPRT